MADAPSGGSSWGAFEVVLVCLLVIAILSNIGKGGGMSQTSFGGGGNTSTTEPLNSSDDSCGISVTNPLSFTKVSNSVRISGLLTGCNWNASGPVALYAQVVDGKGKPLSEYTPVTNDNRDLINVSFDTSIFLYRQATGSGYLILIPATPLSGKSISYRIPLTFIQK